MEGNEQARIGVLRMMGIVRGDTDPAFDDLAALAALVCGTPMAAVSLIDEDCQWFVARVGITHDHVPRNASMCAEVALSSRDGTVVVVPNASLDARFAEHPMVTGRFGIRFYAVAPLVTSDGHVLGSLCVMDKISSVLTSAQVTGLRVLARQVVTQLELRRRSAQLDARDHQLANVLDRTSDAVIALDLELRFTYVNRTAAALAERRGSDLVGRRLFDEFDLRGGELERAIEAARDGTPKHLEYFEPVLRRWLSIRIFPSSDGFSIFASDVTAEQKAAIAGESMTKQLRALTTRLQEVREEEGQRIARELHDDLGQQLTVMKFELAWLVRHAGSDPAVAARLRDMISQADSIMDLVRRIATQLRPHVLDNLGIAAAIDWQTKEFSRRTGIICTVELPSTDVAISQPAGVAMFRALQELLTNVARHALARQITVELAVDDCELVLTVADDGRGFGPDQQPNLASLGLIGIRERVGHVGGTFAIGPRPGGGTLAVVRVRVDRTPDAGSECTSYSGT